MPWEVQKSGKKWNIVRKDTNQVVGSSTTLAKAQASVRARYKATKGK